MQSLISRHLATCGLALALLNVSASAVLATPFVSELVDTTANTGLYARIAIGSDGIEQIAYFDQTGGDLRYAVRLRDGGWRLELIDTTGVTGVGCDLALGPDGAPMITYANRSNHFLKFASRSDGRWQVQNLDSAGTVGDRTAIAVDRLGTVHIAYVRTDNATLRYLYQPLNGAWSSAQTITSSGSPAFSLAADGSGIPKVAYRTGTDVKFVDRNNSAGTWNSEQQVSANADLPALSLDGEGRPYIVHLVNGTFKFLKVSTRVAATGSWIPQTVDSTTSDVIGNPDIAVQPDGSLGVSYRDTTTHVLKYATNRSGVWKPETVFQGGNSGLECTLGLDRQGNPATAYYDSSFTGLRLSTSGIRLLAPLGEEQWAWGTTQAIRWAGSGPVDVELSTDGGNTYAPLVTNISGGVYTLTVPSSSTAQARVRITRLSPFASDESPQPFILAERFANPWWTAPVDTTGSTGSFCSLFLDSNDNPRIAYYSASAGRLRYAAKSGSKWYIESVNGASLGGQYASLAVARDGIAHISYYDFTSGHLDLRYATKVSGAWSDTLLDGTGTTGRMTSLTLDPFGQPEISYYDQTNQRLRFASRATGVWALETIDTQGRGISSLKVDGLGNAHVSYGSTTGLRYALRTPTAGWGVPEVVDGSSTSTGGINSISLDGSGQPHIAYSKQVPFGFTSTLWYAERQGTGWRHEVVDDQDFYGSNAVLRVDEQGTPHICYLAADGDIRHAYRRGGVWLSEVADPVDVLSYHSIGTYLSMVLDSQGNPRLCHQDINSADLLYTSRAIETGEPTPGVTWPAGARRVIDWNGTGTVELALSLDAGLTWRPLASNLTKGQYRLTVPNVPSNYCKVRLTREAPRSVAVSDSTFTINGAISLLAFRTDVDPEQARGVTVSWETIPNVDDLAGYTLTARRASGNSEVLALRARTNKILDASGGVGDSYSLEAINGFGELVRLGEVSVTVPLELTAGPLPIKSEGLNISYTSSSARPLQLRIFDLAGRQVRTLVNGAVTPGMHHLTWDGGTNAGKATPGLYFLRLRQDGQEKVLRLVLVQ